MGPLAYENPNPGAPKFAQSANTGPLDSYENVRELPAKPVGGTRSRARNGVHDLSRASDRLLSVPCSYRAKNPNPEVPLHGKAFRIIAMRPVSVSFCDARLPVPRLETLSPEWAWMNSITPSPELARCQIF